jgi:hypothetical protein
MNWLGSAGIVGAGAVIATLVASGGSIAPEGAVLPVLVPETVGTNQKPMESYAVPKVTPNAPKLERAVAPTKPTTSSCHPGYSGCLKQNAGDYDCAKGSGNGPNYTGPVEVYGSDPFDLDR